MRVDYLGSISEDKKLVQAVRAQQPFVISYPNCEASMDIKRISKKLIGTEEYEYKKGVQALFKKIFSIFG